MISYRKADLLDRFKSQPKKLVSPVYCELRLDKDWPIDSIQWVVSNSPSFAGTKRSIADIKSVLTEVGFEEHASRWSFIMRYGDDDVSSVADDELIAMLTNTMERHGMIIDESSYQDDIIRIGYATESM
jgi:hypothetical protein